LQASIPVEALQSFWTDGYRKTWGVKLHSSTSAEDLLQVRVPFLIEIRNPCVSHVIIIVNTTTLICYDRFEKKKAIMLTAVLSQILVVSNS